MELLATILDRNSKQPLYDQLYAYIKAEILKGSLPYGTRLPSKNKLKAMLNLSQTTVETAYEQLVAEGYVKSEPRRGFFVQAKEELAYHRQSIKARPNSIRKQAQDNHVYDFYPGLIDTSLFPYRVWRRLYRDAICEENRDLLLLGDSPGDFDLREQIRIYLYQSRGVICDTGQIVIGAGIEQLLPQIVALLDEKAVFGVENPGYPLSRNVFRGLKREFRQIDVDSEGAEVKQITGSNISVMYVTPSHQFPMGCIMSANRRMQLLNWAHSTPDRYIIEDDYDGEFRYSGRKIPSLHSLGKGETVIYLSTFSKSLIPSLRIGFMVLPPKLAEKYRKEFSHYASCVSRIDQYVLTRFMSEGYFEKHLNRMRTIYRKKLEIVMDTLKSTGNKIIVSGEKAGLHLLLTFPEYASEKELIAKANERKIKVCGLANFYSDQNRRMPPGIVMGFGGMSEDCLREGLKQLLNCWFP
ncbi:MAG: PLP-dependent aminotransferase family protein [Candidatus Rifleibacteriota bacterium]